MREQAIPNDLVSTDQLNQGMPPDLISIDQFGPPDDLVSIDQIFGQDVKQKPVAKQKPFFKAIGDVFASQGLEAASAFCSGVGGIAKKIDDVAYMVSSSVVLKALTNTLSMEYDGHFEAGVKFWLENAAELRKLAEARGLGYVDKIIADTVGGAIPGIAEFMLNVPWAVLTEAAAAYREGGNPVIAGFIGGAKRFVLGKIFNALSGFNLPTRAIGSGMAFGADAYASGGDVPAAIGSGLLMGVVGPVEGKSFINEFKTGLEQLTGQRPTQADIMKALVKADLRMKEKFLETVKEKRKRLEERYKVDADPVPSKPLKKLQNAEDLVRFELALERGDIELTRDIIKQSEFLRSLSGIEEYIYDQRSMAYERLFGVPDEAVRSFGDSDFANELINYYERKNAGKIVTSEELDLMIRRQIDRLASRSDKHWFDKDNEVFNWLYPEAPVVDPKYSDFVEQLVGASLERTPIADKLTEIVKNRNVDPIEAARQLGEEVRKLHEQPLIEVVSGIKPKKSNDRKLFKQLKAKMTAGKKWRYVGWPKDLPVPGMVDFRLVGESTGGDVALAETKALVPVSKTKAEPKTKSELTTREQLIRKIVAKRASSKTPSSPVSAPTTAVERIEALKRTHKEIVDFLKTGGHEVFEFAEQPVEMANPLGRDFKTEKAARQAMESNGIIGDVIETENGFSIKCDAVVTNRRNMFDDAGIIDPFNDTFNEWMKDPQRGAIEVEGFIDIFKDHMKRIRRFFTFKSTPDIYSNTYQSIYGLVDDLRINNNVALLEGKKLKDKIITMVPEQSNRMLITKAIENDNIESLGKLAPVAKMVKAVYDETGAFAEELGVLDRIAETYVNHIVKETKGKDTNPALSFARRRVRKDGKMLKLEDLERLGYVVEKDIKNLVPAYLVFAQQAINRKLFVRSLIESRTDVGYPVILPIDKLKDLPYEEAVKYIKLPQDSILRAWLRPKKGDENIFSGPPVVIHKDAFSTVDNILNLAPTEFVQLYMKSKAVVKRILLYNILIHGFNFESNVIGVLGRNYPERFGFFKDKANVERTIDEMVRNGVELSGLGDVQVRLTTDITKPELSETITLKALIDDPTTLFRHPWKSFKDVNDVVLWKGVIRTGQVVIYKTIRDRLVSKGMSYEKAGKCAAIMANDLSGTVPRTWFTKGQRTFLRTLLFARDWNVGLFRTLSGSVPQIAKSRFTPKPLRLEGLSNEQIKAVGKSYRGVLLRCLIGSFVTANALQGLFYAAAKMTDDGSDEYFVSNPEWRPTVSNEPGHLLDIYTYMTDNKGRPIYLRNWLFRQIDDYMKAASGRSMDYLKSKLDPILRTAVETLFNIDYRGKQIRKPGMTIGEQVTESLKYIGIGLTPIDSFFDHDGDIRTWFEAIIPLTGTWIRKGMPTGRQDPMLGEILKKYYEFSARTRYESSVASEKISELIQQKKFDEATNLAYIAFENGLLSVGQFVNITKKITAPLFYRLTTSDGKLKSDFMAFVLSLDEKTRARYIKALNNAYANQLKSQ